MSRKKRDSRGSVSGRTDSSNLSRRAMLSATAATSAGLVGAVGSASASDPDYEIRPVIAPDVGNDYTVDAVNSLVDQINEYTYESAEALNTYRTDVSPDPDNDGECEYFAQVANDLDSEGKSSQNQMILVGHKIWKWGYGKSCSYTTWDSNHDIYGGVHCVGWPVQKRVGVNIGIQELGHNEPWHLGHGDGRVEVKDSTNAITSVSPMATAYAYDRTKADTEACESGFSGSGHVPTEFCNGYDNESADDFYCYSLWTDTISLCYQMAVDSHGGW